MTPPDGAYEAGSDADLAVYEDNPDFNAYLDEQGPVTVEGVTFDASRVLHMMEPKTYAAALGDFRDREREDLLDSICADYPSPIAYNFYRYLNSAEHARQRLDLLRDTWESAINLLHALVVVELHQNGVRFIDADVSARMLFSEKLAARLVTIERLLKYAAEQGIKCECVDRTWSN